MKKLFGKSFLALVLAMTMLLGMSMTVMAGQPASKPWGTCSAHDGENIVSHCYVFKIDEEGVHFDEYNPDGEKQGSSYCVPRVDLEQQGLNLDNLSVGNWFHVNMTHHRYEWCVVQKASEPHTHSYEWSVLSDPTTEQDGVEAYICSCGDIQATQPISAAHNILKLNADAVKNAKADATVVVDLGRLNSLPKWFVTKLVERDDLNVTLKITYNHQNYTLEIPKTATIEDESIEWYGPLKLLSMFPQK